MTTSVRTIGPHAVDAYLHIPFREKFKKVIFKHPTTKLKFAVALYFKFYFDEPRHSLSVFCISWNNLSVTIGMMSQINKLLRTLPTKALTSFATTKSSLSSPLQQNVDKFEWLMMKNFTVLLCLRHGRNARFKELLFISKCKCQNYFLQETQHIRLKDSYFTSFIDYIYINKLPR